MKNKFKLILVVLLVLVTVLSFVTCKMVRRHKLVQEDVEGQA